MKQVLILFTIVLLCRGLMAGDDATPQVSDDTIREFHQAIADGDQRTTSEMLEVYPDLLESRYPNSDPNGGATPLVTAAAHGRTALARTLIDKGANIEAGGAGKKPLYFACSSGQNEMVKVLLDAGADINGGVPTDLSGVTPLRAALMWGHVDTARLLLRRGARFDVFAAAGLGWSNWINKRLKDHPDWATLKDGWGLRPLGLAVTCGCAGAAKVLLEHGASANEDRDGGGTTYLMWAAIYGHTEVIEVLLNHGAEVNAHNALGLTALDFAVEKRQPDAARILRQHGGREGSHLPEPW